MRLLVHGGVRLLWREGVANVLREAHDTLAPALVIALGGVL